MASSPAITADTLAARSADVVSERFGNRVVVLEPVQDRYVRLNRTGALLWEALDGPRACGDLAERLAGATRVPRDRAEADVAAFLAALAEKGLVVLTPPAPPPG